MRIPIFVKVLVSFLLVIALGAIPTVLYLQNGFQRQVLDEAEQSLAAQLRKMIPVLVPLSVPQRQAELRQIAKILPQRITYIAQDGRVLFDSHVADVTQLENHLARPEVQQVLNGAFPTAGVEAELGSDTRSSASTSVPTLYVAALVPDDGDARADVLRLAISIDAIHRRSDSLIGVIRNSYALSVSVALLLSLLASFMVVRPLRKLAETARQMAAGDYAAVRMDFPHDELGDVGRTLNLLAQQVRRTLASVRSGEGLLVQFVEDLPLPVAIVDEDCLPVAVNALGWEAAGATRDHHADLLAEFFRSPALQAALEQAAASGDCQPIHSTETPGLVSLLQRPQASPLRCFIGMDRRRPSADSDALPKRTVPREVLN